MPAKLQQLTRKLHYDFQNPKLLQQALTHRSADALNNERLEFLGDSALSLVIAEALYQQFPQLSEGKLSRLRASLVCGDMLAVIARELDLGSYLILGQGELKSGGFRRTSILADALEAILAAIYLDGGFTAVQQVVLRLFASRLADHSLQHHLKDYKTRLQEYLQSVKKPLPEYSLLTAMGQEHEQLFEVQCRIPDTAQQTSATGPSRRKAEQSAAKAMLRLLQQD
ncbi:MAG: ribonuclease III [Legionellaceae bacterium]|nr:ribonuclease III [Legionellaceae bacterium]